MKGLGCFMVRVFYGQGVLWLGCFRVGVLRS